MLIAIFGAAAMATIGLAAGAVYKENTAACTGAEIEAVVSPDFTLSRQLDPARLKYCSWSQGAIDARLLRAAKNNNVEHMLRLVEKATLAGVDAALIAGVAVPWNDDDKTIKVAEILGFEASRTAVNSAFQLALLAGRVQTADRLLVLGAIPDDANKIEFCAADARGDFHPVTRKLPNYRKIAVACEPRP
jgi:hypothetical protein